MKLKTIRQFRLTPRIITELVILGLVIVAFTVAGVSYYAKEGSLAAEKAEEALIQERLKELTPKSNAPIASTTPENPTASSSSSNSQSRPSPSISPSQHSSSQTVSPSSNPASTPAAQPTPTATSPVVDSDTPQVALTYPSVWGQIVSGVITISATAADNISGIQKVVLMVRKIGVATPIHSITDTTAPTPRHSILVHFPTAAATTQ